MTKKRLLIWGAIILFSINSFAQISPKGEADLFKYYAYNADKLDPIECAYDVRVLQWGENLYQRFPAEEYDLKLMIYKDLNGNFKIYGNDQVTIKKIAGSRYKYETFWEGSDITSYQYFDLEDNIYFEVEISVPKVQLKYDLGVNYHAGYKVKALYSFTKYNAY